MRSTSTTPAVRAPGDLVWTLLPAWAAHLHDADPVTFQHMAADAEYPPRSPLADRMRSWVDAEQQLRTVTA